MGSLVPFAESAGVAELADILIDSAVLIVDGVQLTVSRGGWSFDPGEEWDDYSFPGKTMAVVGARQLVRLRPTFKATTLLSGEDQITALRPDGAWADHATITGARTFTPNALRTYLTGADYLTNVWCLWKRQRGDYIAVEFPIAICGDWGVGATDGDEGLFQVVIEAVQDNATAGGTTRTRPPYRIRTVPTPPDPETPAEPPTPLGRLLLDLNRDSLVGFVQDDPVGAWADDATDDGAQDALNGPGSPYPYTQFPPVYQEDAFGAGQDGVAIVGSDVGLLYPNPWTDSWTYYLVFKLLSSDDRGVMLGSNGDAGSNFIIFANSDGSLRAGVNRSAFDENEVDTAGTYLDGQPHIARFVWRRNPGHWWLYVDGTLAAENNVVATTFQTLTTYGELGGRVGYTLAIAYYLGRLLLYDTPHIGTDGEAVESVLRTQFGL